MRRCYAALLPISNREILLRVNADVVLLRYSGSQSIGNAWSALKNPIARVGITCQVLEFELTPLVRTAVSQNTPRLSKASAA